MRDLYVSHRLDEVLAIADTISLLRDGATCATLPAKEVTHTKLVELMTGRDAEAAGSGTAVSDEAPVVLSVRNLGGRGDIGLSFDLGRAKSSASSASPMLARKRSRRCSHRARPRARCV